MYEENLEPLPAGNALQAFAPIFAELKRQCSVNAVQPLTHEKVLFWADPGVQKYLARIARRLLLPGSGIVGLKNLQQLVELATDGPSCVICLNHRSNLDVPTLCAMLQDAGRQELFDKIIWIAGRKLQEDLGMTGMLVQAFNRIMVTPRSWLHDHSEWPELHEGHQINIAAWRAIHELRHKGRVFALFPTGTRLRSGDSSTTRAVPEIDTYLKSFDYLLTGNIDGCSLPVSRNKDMTRETPRVRRITISFGEVVATADWRQHAAHRYPQYHQRRASAHAIMADINSLVGRDA